MKKLQSLMAKTRKVTFFYAFLLNGNDVCY
jgi:hypothetical protein